MKLRSFFRREDGSYSVETVLMFPLLFWAFGATFVFWDAFKLRNNALSGTYTVADMISRQQQAVDADFLAGLDDVFDAVVGGDRPLDMRVTVMRMDQGADPDVDPPVLNLVWSHSTGDMPEFVDAAGLEDMIPVLAVGATLVMVETEVTWVPPLTGIIGQTDIGNRVFASPRFRPQIGFDDGTIDNTEFPDDGDGDKA